ncbi:MAG: type II toxin-antitoxin system RelE family toxin [Microcystaceae cyanobacterium]
MKNKGEKNYQIIFDKRAAKQLKKLPKEIQGHLKSKIAELSINPRPPGVVKLTGKDKIYRVRVGDYRIIYQIQDNELIILIAQVSDRKNAYKDKI